MRSQIVAIGSTTCRNRVGRAFSLWLTAREAGLDFDYIGIDDGPLWEPLRTQQDFVAHLRTASDVADLERQASAAIGPDAVLVICKPRPELVRLARELPRSVPVLVDVDDPELEAPWGPATLKNKTALVLRYGPSRFRFRWARRALKKMHVITSNPRLQSLYGGAIVPHVREPVGQRTLHETRDGVFRVGFIGTPRPHKGISEVRAAVGALAAERPARLCVTAPEPGDAEPWEEWVGETSLQDGLRLVAGCDAVVIASRPGPWGDFQVPVKLVDAMHAAVPAVITPRSPLLWATGDSALVVPDDCAAGITKALRLLADDPNLARALGAAAMRRALATFTPRAAAPNLVAAIADAEGGPVP